MKGKARSLLMLLLIGFFIIGTPSCDGPDYAVIRGIQSAEFFDIATHNTHPGAATISEDTMIILMRPRIEYFTEVSHTGTMNQAWAFSPVDPIMANEISDIRISTDKEMYEIPAGQDLSGVLQFGTWQDSRLSLSDFLNDFLRKGSDYYYEESIFVFFNGKPATGDYTFQIELEDNNGHVFTATTAQLSWQ